MPNAGFLEDVVFEDPASSSRQTSDASDDATDSSHNQPSETNGKEVDDSVGAAEEHPILDSASVSQIEGKNDTAEGITSGVADLKVTDTTTADESVVEDQQPLSIEDVDMLLDKCLLQALHTTVKDKDLPMPGSTLW